MGNPVKDLLVPAERPRHGAKPRRTGFLLRAGVAVAGAALVLTSLDGVTYAAGQGVVARDYSAASVLMARDLAGAAVSVADKPENPGRGRGNGNRGGGQANRQGNDDHPGNGVGLGLLVNGRLDDDQANELADDLADEFANCLNDGDEVENMRVGQIKHLARVAGLSIDDVKEALADEESDEDLGLDRLVREELDDGADELADALGAGIEDSLEDGEDLDRIKLGHLLQAARACGITTQEIKEMLRDVRDDE
ncbi:MAG: hypothetical protein M3O34_17005 [Chloroflexota bacterium]|nr:hypothetical protein [Chloroflexota bacterium]